MNISKRNDAVVANSSDSQNEIGKKQTLKKGKTQSTLLKTKKELDRLMEGLAAYPDLLIDIKALRDRVLERFIDEEKTYPI